MAESLLHLMHGPSPAATGDHHRPRAPTRRRTRTPRPRPPRLRSVLRPLGRDLGTPGARSCPHRRRRPLPGREVHGPARRIRVGPAPDRRRRRRHQEDEGAHRAGTDPLARGSPVPPEAGARVSVGHRVDGAAAPAAPPHPRGEHTHRARGAGRSGRARPRRPGGAPRGLPFLRADPEPLAPRRGAAGRWHPRATRSPPRPTSSPTWREASGPHLRRCATTTAGSPDGPAESSSASSTGSTTHERVPGRLRPPPRRAINIRAVRAQDRR